MTPLFEAVHIPFHTQFIDDGRVRASEVMQQSADALLDELLRTQAALRALRA
jgi:hypothetical protein